MKIKISAVDRLFSLFIRDRANWKCERCGTQYSHPTMALHNSHFYGRGRKSVRWDEDNCIAACYGCHQYLGANPMEHNAFFMARLGRKRFDSLTLRANTPMSSTQVNNQKAALKIWLTAYCKEKGLLPSQRKQSFGPVFGIKAK